MSGPLLKEAPVLPPLPENVNETFKILENNPVVKDALKQIKEEEQLTMADQIALRLKLRLFMKKSEPLTLQTDFVSWV